MDITKCSGNDCPIKDKCYRYTCKTDEYWQSFFSDTPFEIIDNKFTCDMFYGDSQDAIMSQLENIVKGLKFKDDSIIKKT